MTSFKALTIGEDFLGNSEFAGKILFIFASGYESRSLHLLDQLERAGQLDRIKTLGFTFENFPYAASRPANDARLKALNITPIVLRGDSEHRMIATVKTELVNLVAEGKEVQVVIDYSSMPRQWYCELLRLFSGTHMTAAATQFWYVHGSFGNQEYPCVGYGDFKVFSGQPRVTKTSEVHIFGLGLDSVRTYGIWNFLDPQFTCCLIGVATGNQSLIERVRSLNHEILLAADIVEEARFDDFPKLLASVVDLARKCASLGDVCLVADGPKPLVLAMSIAPDVFGRPGVSSWHVSHVKPHDYVPMDVAPTERISGFSVYTSEDSRDAKFNFRATASPSPHSLEP